MPYKNIFFYFEFVSGFLGLCQAKWNEISRTNPEYSSIDLAIVIHYLEKTLIYPFVNKVKEEKILMHTKYVLFKKEKFNF